MAGPLLALGVVGSAHAGFTVLHHFIGGSDGTNPRGALIQDSAGNLYGTTAGDSNTVGGVFKLMPDGTLTVLHIFARKDEDGSDPEGGLVQDEAGNLYGTTYSGPLNVDGHGIVFEIAPEGSEKVLYTFTGGSDGGNPKAGLIIDKAGNLYGTTLYGGSHDRGTVFKLARDGTETVLHAFHGGRDGADPYAGLIRDKNGSLYGTTLLGGGSDCANAQGCGTVFKIAPDGTETVLHAFDGDDGACPYGGLVEDSAGNLYGTTTYQGRTDCADGLGSGTVFKLAPDGTETVLHVFSGGRDGGNPYAGLTLDRRGNLYGTTSVGGGCWLNGGCGTVFQLARDGSETVLHAFLDGDDGRYPFAALIKGRTGLLYGTASASGDCHNGTCGSVFALGR
ncbi:MAG: hypothetical protein JO261_02560 [Alphaproteobacteria bacterium]|nr:hypothetical protein [Alphaproteobacteria bacterium]